MTDVAEVPKEDHVELIKNAGREMAEIWMRGAVESAENEDQMNNQIFALQAAAISILAHHALNRKIQHSVTYEESLHEFKCEFASEVRLLDESDETIELVSPGERDE